MSGSSLTPPLCSQIRNIGFPLKKGQLVEVNFEDLKGIFRVAKDVEWNADFDSWGSVWLEGTYPPRFTHKGGITLLSANMRYTSMDS